MRIRALDGLRGLAAVIVLLGHFQLATGFGSGLLPLGTGKVGVMLFFALSGFLMGLLYLSRAPSIDNIIDFYQKRAARVFPLYLLIVLFSYLSYNFVDSIKAYPITGDNLHEHLLFWRGESVLWTVAIEVQFYIFFPLLWLLHAKTQQNFSTTLLLLICLLLLLSYINWMPEVVVYLPMFLFGVLGSLYCRCSMAHGPYLFLIALALFIVALPGPRSMLLADHGVSWADSVYLIIMPVLIVSCFNNKFADIVLGNFVAAFIGKISYSMYLNHMLVLWFMQPLGLIDKSFSSLAVYSLAVVLVSWLTYLIVEAPARKWIGGL